MRSNDSVRKNITYATLFAQILNNVGIATSAAVLPVVTLFGVGVLITILFLLYNYQFKRSLIIIRFSNPDTPGSLAQMLKVFKVILINTNYSLIIINCDEG